MAEAKPSAWGASALSEVSAAWRVKKMFAPQAILVLLPDGSAKMYVEELTVADLLNEFPGHHCGSATSHRSFLAHDKVLHLGSTYYLSRQLEESHLDFPSRQSTMSQQVEAANSPRGLDSPSGLCALRLPETVEALKGKKARRLAAIDSSLSPAQWSALNGLESRKLHSNSSVCSSASSSSDVFSVLSPRTPRGPLDAESCTASGTSSPHSPAVHSPRSYAHTGASPSSVQPWRSSDKTPTGRNTASSMAGRTLTDLAADVVSGQQVGSRFPDMADDTWDCVDVIHSDSQSSETSRHRGDMPRESERLKAQPVPCGLGARKQGERDVTAKAWDVFREGARKQQQSQGGAVLGARSSGVPRFGRVLSLPRSVDVMGSVAAAFDRALQSQQQRQQLKDKFRSRSSRFDIFPSAGLRSEATMDAAVPVTCLPGSQMSLLSSLAVSIRPASLVPCGLRRTTSSTEQASHAARAGGPRPATASGSGRGRRTGGGAQGLPPRPSSPVIPFPHTSPQSQAVRESAWPQSPSSVWRSGSGGSSGGGGSPAEAQARGCARDGVGGSGSSSASSDRIAEHFNWRIAGDNPRCKHTALAAGPSPAPAELGSRSQTLPSGAHLHCGASDGRRTVGDASASGSRSGPCSLTDAGAGIHPNNHNHSLCQARFAGHCTVSLPTLNVVLARTGDSPSLPSSSSPSSSSSSPTAPLSPNAVAMSSPARGRVHRPSRFKGE